MEEIINLLKKIEKEEDIEILYAVESGSRAWGFNNENSDYDIRFIFKRPIKTYIALSNKKESINYMIDDYDLVGWDIKKTLHLHFKDNPNLREWIKSNIVYMGNTDFLKGLPDFNKDILKYHYSNIAYSEWQKILTRPENDRKTTKHYLYCIRSILSWICADLEKDASINIFDLMEDSQIDDNLKNDINALVDYYKNLCKTELNEDVISHLNAWINEYIVIMKKFNSKPETKDLEIYDEKLFEILEIK